MIIELAESRLMAECDEVASKLSTFILSFIKLTDARSKLETIRRVVPLDATESWEKLNVSFARDHADVWDKIESLLKELPKVCK